MGQDLNQVNLSDTFLNRHNNTEILVESSQYWYGYWKVYLKNNQILYFPCFTFIPKTSLRKLPKTVLLSFFFFYCEVAKPDATRQKARHWSLWPMFIRQKWVVLLPLLAPAPLGNQRWNTAHTNCNHIKFLWSPVGRTGRRTFSSRVRAIPVFNHPIHLDTDEPRRADRA